MFRVSDFYKHYCCSFRVAFLAFFWTASLIYGVCYSAKDLYVVSLMHLLPFTQVSIVGLVVVLILPFSISILCAYYRKPVAIYLLSIIKGFLSGYCLGGVASAYVNAGWLVYILLLFSDSCATLILLWFWYRHINMNIHSLKKDSVIAAIYIAVIGLLDYFVVSPFMVSLVNQL